MDAVGVARRVDAEDLRGPPGRSEQAGEETDRRGLARTVRAEEAEHAPGGNLEIECVERELVPVTLGEIAGADRGFHGRRCSPDERGLIR
jgi:hypothetical protein